MNATSPITRAYIQASDRPVSQLAAEVGERSYGAALEAAGAIYTRQGPARARFFARGCGQRAKTDRVDARMLARMGLE